MSRRGQPASTSPTKVLPVALGSPDFAASSNWSSETEETCVFSDEPPNMPPPRPDVKDDIPQPPRAANGTANDAAANTRATDARLPRIAVTSLLQGGR